MGIFEQFPYANFHELNADWLMKELLKLKTTVEEFVSINALKYADPIQWSIIRQYEKNTIIIDPLTGTAYISVQPVPSGVALTRTEYWTVVFDLGSFVVRAAKNFTNKYEEDTTLTATFPSSVNDWLIWGDTLYKVISNIVPGNQYVVNSNIQHFTIEDIIGHLEDLTTADKSNIVAAINEVMTIIGSLADLTTVDKSNIVAAINELVVNISDIQTLIGDDTLTTTAQTLTGAINELDYDILLLSNYVTPEMFGAVGDGLTDDTAAVQAAFNSGKNVLADNLYYCDDLDITLDNIIVFGHGTFTKIPTVNGSYEFFNLDGNNIILFGLNIIGDRDTHLGSTGEWGSCIIIKKPNCKVLNCNISGAWGDGIYINANSAYVDKCHLDHNSRNGISVIKSKGFSITNSTITDTSRTAPMYAIDVEPNANNEDVSGVIDNIITSNNVGGSVLLSLQNVNNDTEIIVRGVRSYSDCSAHTNNYGCFALISKNASKPSIIFDDIIIDGCVYYVFGVDMLDKAYDTDITFNAKLNNCSHTSSSPLFVANNGSKVLKLRCKLVLTYCPYDGLITNTGNAHTSVFVNINRIFNYPNITSNPADITYVDGIYQDLTSMIRTDITGMSAEGVNKRIITGFDVFYLMHINMQLTTSSNLVVMYDTMKATDTINNKLVATNLDDNSTVDVYLSPTGDFYFDSVPTAGHYEVKGVIHAYQT